MEIAHRTLYLSKQVNQESMNELTKEIVKINQADAVVSKTLESMGATYNPSPIQIYIDSYGGQVYACLGLLGAMELSKTPVHTIVTGCAMSAGFAIAISGHRRFCFPYSTYMYHSVSSGLWGKVEGMQEDLVEVKRIQKLLEDLTLQKTKMTRVQLDENRKRKQDWYITPAQAKRLGVVDEVLKGANK